MRRLAWLAAVDRDGTAPPPASQDEALQAEGPAVAGTSIPLARILGHQAAAEQRRHDTPKQPQVSGAPDVNGVGVPHGARQPPHQTRQRSDVSEARPPADCGDLWLGGHGDVESREWNGVLRRRLVAAGGGHDHLGEQVGPHVDLSRIGPIRVHASGVAIVDHVAHDQRAPAHRDCQRVTI